MSDSSPQILRALRESRMPRYQHLIGQFMTGNDRDIDHPIGPDYRDPVTLAIDLGKNIKRLDTHHN